MTVWFVDVLVLAHIFIGTKFHTRGSPAFGDLTVSLLAEQEHAVVETHEGGDKGHPVRELADVAGDCVLVGGHLLGPEVFAGRPECHTVVGGTSSDEVVVILHLVLAQLEGRVPGQVLVVGGVGNSAHIIC